MLGFFGTRLAYAVLHAGLASASWVLVRRSGFGPAPAAAVFGIVALHPTLLGTPIDDVNHVQKYCVDGKAPIPIANYIGTWSMFPVTDGSNSTFVQWSSTFDIVTPPEGHAEVAKNIEGLFTGALAVLKEKCESA